MVLSTFYGLSPLRPNHFRAIESGFFRLLRSALGLGIKATFISRASSIRVWDIAGTPLTAAQLVLKQQIETLL